MLGLLGDGGRLDDRLLRGAAAEGPPAARAEMRTAQDGCAALAPRDVAPDVQELFDLREPRIDSYNRGSTLGEQVVAEAAAAVHLDEEAAEIGERVLARLQERPTLAAKHAGLRATWRDAFGVVCAPAKKRGHPGRV
jgi:hypothetical protein